MAHGLDIRDGKAAMMYTGKRPWHGLGKRLESQPKTPGEALAASGLDWTVRKCPLFAFMKAGEQAIEVEVPRRVAILREPQGEFLGEASESYEPLQNEDAMRFCHRLVEQSKGAYETAGALFSGKRIWVQIRLSKTFEVVKNDRVDRFLLFSNSHEGGVSALVKLTPIRVVCNNTLSAAVLGGGEIKIAHTKFMESDFDDALGKLGLIERKFAAAEDVFRRIAQKPIDFRQLVDYVTLVLPIPKLDDDASRSARQRLEKDSDRIHDAWCDILRLHEEGVGAEIPGVRGTLWGAYNAVTEYVDHRPRERKSDDQIRSSIWFGEGSKLKDHALDVARSMAN